MQWNTDPTTKRIDCAAADLIDELCAQPLPAPCRRTGQQLWDWLTKRYPVESLPEEHPAYAQTALSTLELYCPEDVSYLPPVPEQRAEAALHSAPDLQLRCVQLRPEGSALPLYEEQEREFRRRVGDTGLPWKRQPILVCLELTHGYRLVIGSQTLSDELTVAHGITQGDLDDRSPELLASLRARHALSL